MSGFSAEWLQLREAADRKARNAPLLRSVAEMLSGRDEAVVVDLACGTGSNLRALAPHFPARQHWLLVDHDPVLLDAARQALAAWADEARSVDGHLALTKDGLSIEVGFAQRDLAREIERILDMPADLVTASALFDLVSEQWIARMVASLAARRMPLYAALTYNGVNSWTPPHPSDDAVRSAFCAHQLRDKGLGSAAGPHGARLLADAFARAGYRVTTGDSPWIIGESEPALMREAANGIAQAAAETGLIAKAELVDWLVARLAASSCTIGHTDVLAVPA